MRARGLIDFDDLMVGAVAALEADLQLRGRWQARFSHLCVDEFQDGDAVQLRLVQLLAAPEDNLFVVGDDDQPQFMIRTYRSARPLDLASPMPADVATCGNGASDLPFRAAPSAQCRLVRLQSVAGM